MEDPGGAEKTEHGGWSFPYWSDSIARFKLGELFSAEALLLGRVTYQGFAAAWPSMKDEQGYADRMNSLPKHVVSRTLDSLAWNNSRLVRGDLLAEVSNLKKRYRRDILVFGSSTLAQALMQEGLVDEFRVMVYPVVLGRGKRLFAERTHATLKPVGTQVFDSGVVLLLYQSAKKSQQKGPMS